MFDWSRYFVKTWRKVRMWDIYEENGIGVGLTAQACKNEDGEVKFEQKSDR